MKPFEYKRSKTIREMVELLISSPPLCEDMRDGLDCLVSVKRQLGNKKGMLL